MLHVINTSRPEQHAGLIAVDETLRDLSGDTNPGRRKLRAFYAAVLQSLDGNPRPHDESLIGELFSSDWSKQQRRLVAVCLLRLLATTPAAFDDPRLIGKSEALWDESLGDLYKQLRIGATDGSYEKRQALRDAIPQAENGVKIVIEDIRGVTDTSGLRVVREQWRNRIDRHGALIAPFLPSELLRKRNDQLFEAAAAVYDADDAELLRVYQHATDICREYEGQAKDFGTLYASALCGELAAELARQLERHKASRALKPAEIAVGPGNKHYPLHEKGRELKLSLAVSNTGQGVALDTRLSIDAVAGIDVPSTEIFLGTVRSGLQIVECVAVAEGSEDGAEMLGTITWRNTDGSSGDEAFDVVFPAQRCDLDWSALSGETPYRLTALDDPSQLIGRDQLLSGLEASVRAQSMSSSVITGHKRVGKTSIVMCLKTLLEEKYDDTIVAYLQIGKYRSAPKSLYNGIAKAIASAARQFGESDQKLANLHRPDFEDGFVEILDLVDDLLDVSPALKLVLVLDEFDELPTRLYQINDEAAAFFNTLRDFVAQPRRGLLLVGGEKLNFVLAANGAALNLLESHRVDDFRREDQFGDFENLVTRPASGVLDFEEGSVERIFDETAGHPYFAKMVCKSLFREMKARRDTSVTPNEVDDAIADALRSAGITSFAHFWDDGIFESDPGRIQAIALARRLALLAIGRALASDAGPTRSQIETEAKRLSLGGPELIQALSGLEQRRILVSERDSLMPRIPFFRRWLVEYGPTEIVREVTDDAARASVEAGREEAVIRQDELSDVVKTWSPYRGRSVTAEDLRKWLRQFGGAIEQRRALHVIRHLRFYNSAEVRGRLAAAHQRITAGWLRQLKRGQAVFTDVLVVPLDEPGKTCGILYQSENQIHKANAVALSGLAQRLAATKREIRAVVFVDNFVGTGESAIARFEALDPAVRSRIRANEILAAFVCVSAFREGLERFEQWLRREELPVNVYPGEVLGDADRAFSSSSTIFEDAGERSSTRALFEELGRDIDAQHPLGWEDSQALIVFEASVPRNSLPHLWSEATGVRQWRPLFPRF